MLSAQYLHAQNIKMFDFDISGSDLVYLLMIE